MTRNEERLRVETVMRSSVPDWYEALKEWYLYDIEEGHGSCACGKTPSKHIVTLSNKVTGNSLIVGSSCVEKFFNIPSSKLFKDIKLLEKDLRFKVSKETLRFAIERDIFSEWDIEFYESILKYGKALSEKQIAIVIKLNKRILINLCKTYKEN